MIRRIRTTFVSVSDMSIKHGCRQLRGPYQKWYDVIIMHWCMNIEYIFSKLSTLNTNVSQVIQFIIWGSKLVKLYFVDEHNAMGPKMDFQVKRNVWQEQFYIFKGGLLKTSLKIFKHNKLKPSFSIIKDEKANDKVGVEDKPSPPSCKNLIKFDPI